MIMLDKRCFALLEYLNRQCLNTGYKVFSNEELIGVLPAEYGMDIDSLKECLKDLAEREYVSIKFLDDKEVCLCPLTKGRLVFENRLEDEIVKSRAEKRYFLSGAIGALTGGVIGSLIQAVIFFLAGGR